MGIMGNTNSNESDTVNLKMSKEQHQIAKQQKRRNEYILKNEYERYNQNKKNVDNRMNNYQMFNTRRHDRNFIMSPIGINTSATDITSNFSPKLKNSKLAYTKPPIIPSKNKYNIPRNHTPKVEQRKSHFNKSTNELTIEKCDPFN